MSEPQLLESRGRLRPWPWVRAIAPVLVGLVVFVFGALNCWIKCFRVPFWVDEVTVHALLADTHFAHMLQALGDQIKCTPPLYWVVGWSWARIFGVSEMSLRMYSVCALAVAAMILFACLRRFFGGRAAFVSVVIALFGSRSMLFHMNEAGYYPFFLAATALALYCAVRAMRVGLCWKDFGLLFLSQAALGMTHPHGIFYGVLLLCAVVVRALVRGRPGAAARLALCGFAGQMVLLSWWRQLRVYSQLETHAIPPPLSWLFKAYFELVPTPTVRCLKDYWRNLQNHPSVPMVFGSVVAALLLGAAFYLMYRHESSRRQRPIADAGSLPLRVAGAVRNQRFQLLVGGLLMAAPTTLWIISHLRTGLFLSRYCVPSLLGVAILLAWVVQQTSRYSLFWRAFWVWLTIPFLVEPVAESRLAVNSHQAMAACIEQMRTADYVICEDLWHALVLDFYCPAPHFYYVLDAATALGAGATRGSILSYKTAAALRRQYASRCVLTLEEAQTKLSWRRFLVIGGPFQNDLHPEEWRAKGFEVRDLGPLADGGGSGPGFVLAVERKSAF